MQVFVIFEPAGAEGEFWDKCAWYLKLKPLLQGPLLVQAKKGKPSDPTAHNLVWEGRQMEFTLT